MERPILFSGPMVKAILDGRKTMTRRVVKGKTALEWLEPGVFSPSFVGNPENGLCPYGKPGDLLWVRETFAAPFQHLDCEEGKTVFYRADGAQQDDGQWSPSIFMPRWASRITLEVAGVRVERLQEITDADALAEGVNTQGPYFVEDYEKQQSYTVAQFAALWDSINGKTYPWDSNPWVWVIEFTKN